MSQQHSPCVVVTGMGVVSGWGWGLSGFREGLRSGGTAIRPFDRFDHSAYFTHVAAQVPAPPAELAARLAGPGRGSTADQFAVGSALEALAHAGLGRDLSARSAGVFFGSSTGGMLETEEFYESFRKHERDRVDLVRLASQPVSAPGETIARTTRAHGPVLTVSSACSSATLALGMALQSLREGSVDSALAGGADALCRTTYGGFNSLRSVDERPSQPFRAGRAGLSLGEGGATLVLERLDSARERGARPLAELLGSAATGDANHMTAPHPEGRGAALAVRRALEDAGIEPDAVDFINAHGTGTELNDVAEFRALKSVFGARVSELPVVATKASVGHLLGSAGAIEAAATILCLTDQELHAVPGDAEIDPDTPVRLITGGKPVQRSLRVGVSLNLAFGGCNGALVLSRWAES